MRKLIITLTITFGFLLLCGFSREDQKVFDDANLFSSTEINDLQEEVVEMAEQYKLDIIIVTTNHKAGKASVAYADDFYDYNNFGYDHSQGTGILLLIDMEDRTVVISTSGDAIQMFSDRTLEKMKEAITPYLSKAEYYNASSLFLKKIENVGSSGSVEGEKTPLQNFYQNWWIYLIISLAGSSIITFLIYISHRSSTSIGSRTYLADNQYQLRKRTDQFTHTTTITRQRETSSNGSSTHSGSSGNSHGGTSGKF
jgi:uncharacterized protein